MKKVFFLALLAITAASCKKEQMNPLQNQAKSQSMEEQVANVIKQADQKMYKKIYGGQPHAKEPKADVRYLPGVFYIPNIPGPSGGIDNATCLGTNKVCMVIFTAPKSETGSIAAITGNINETFDSAVSTIILNNGSAPTVMPLSHLQVSTENGINVHFN